jgi:hypothetical protein
MVVSDVRVSIDYRGFSDDQIVIAYPDTPICFSSSPNLSSSTFQYTIPEGASIVYSTPPDRHYCAGTFEGPGAQTVTFSQPAGEIGGIWVSATTNVKGAVLLFDSGGITYSMNIAPNVYATVVFSEPLLIQNIRMLIQDADSNDGAGIGYLGTSASGENKGFSMITIDVYPSSALLGENLTVSGLISPAHSAKVTLTYTRPNSSVSERIIMSAADGTFEDVIAPDALGTWNVLAEWSGDSDHLGASSGSVVFEVKEERHETEDTTPPAITVPDDIVLEATGPEGSRTSFEVSAQDDFDGSVDVTCSHDSGDTFPVGQITVTCTARDAAGNVAEKSFMITVQEPPPPPPGFPDLTPTQIYLENPNSPIGKKVDIVCRLMNQGDKNAGSFDVDFYVDGSRVKTMSVDRVPLNSPDLVEANGAWIQSPGIHTLKCVVDAADTVNEGIENNNSLEVSIGSSAGDAPTADLYIAGVSWAPSHPLTGEQVTFSYREANSGTATASQHTLTLMIDGVSTRLIDTGPISGSASRDGNFPSWKCTDGAHIVRVIADSGNSISESNEGNNAWTNTISCANVIITPIPAPQLPPISVPLISENQVQAEIWAYKARTVGEYLKLFDPAGRPAELSTQLYQDGQKFLEDAIESSLEDGEIEQLRVIFESIIYAFEFYADAAANYEIAMAQLHADPDLAGLNRSLTELKKLCEQTSDAYRNDQLDRAESLDLQSKGKADEVLKYLDGFVEKMTEVKPSYTNRDSWSVVDARVGEEINKTYSIAKGLNHVTVEVHQAEKPWTLFSWGQPTYNVRLEQEPNPLVIGGELYRGDVLTCYLTGGGSTDDGARKWNDCRGVPGIDEATIRIEPVDFGYDGIPWLFPQILSTDLAISVEFTYDTYSIDEKLVDDKFREFRDEIAASLKLF